MKYTTEGQAGSGLPIGPSTGLWGLVAVLCLAWFTLTFGAMHLVQSDLNPIETLASQYANGTAGWLVNLAFIVAGVGLVALALGLRRSLTQSRWTRAAVVALIVAAVGSAGSGVFPEDVPLSDGTVGYSFSGRIHNIASILLFLGVIAAAFLLANAFRRDERCRPVAGRTRLAAWLFLLGLVVSVGSSELGPTPGTDGSIAGLVQRIFATGMLLWLAWLSLLVRRQPG